MKIYVTIYVLQYMCYNISFSLYFGVIIFNNSYLFYLDFVDIKAGTETIT
jgi:hypothetical protein